MSTSMADCGSKDPDVRERTCLTCDIPVFCRNHYYRGKLLTERDFSDEQRYAIDKMRLHNLALHGWGVVCGLVVKPHLYCPELRLVVEPGFAIDDCGHEIRLVTEDWVELPQPRKKPAEGESATTSQKENGHRQSEGYRSDPHQRVSSEPCDGDEEVPLPDNPCDNTPMPHDLYLCIRYAECETEFSPAPFDDCSCSDSSQRPNRVCEGYKLELYDHKPDFWDKATHQECEYDNCRQYYHEARERCPKINCFPYVPLAVIYNVVPGQAVKKEQIENWKPRRQLASTETLDKIVRCILDKIPTEKLTCINYTNWDHGRRIHCHEFVEKYVGSPEHPQSFRIQFSQKVHSGAINTRSFQALVVFRTDNMADARHMQIAPAHIDKGPDETDWCQLRIDPAYVRRHLDGRDFDLFIILKCDVITDLHGRAVDGNYIGYRLPTGDNIQGGTFESWLRVRPRPRNTGATSGREGSL